MIRHYRDEQNFYGKRKLLAYQIQMNTLFYNNYGRKIGRCDRNIHNAMQITNVIIKQIKFLCYSSTEKCM